MTIFDCLNDIIRDKTGTLSKNIEFRNTWNSFMICRWLSMDPRFITIAEEANRYQCIWSQEQMYNFLLKRIPKQSNAYIKYIKKT